MCHLFFVPWSKPILGHVSSSKKKCAKCEEKVNLESSINRELVFWPSSLHEKSHLGSSNVFVFEFSVTVAEGRGGGWGSSTHPDRNLFVFGLFRSSFSTVVIWPFWAASSRSRSLNITAARLLSITEQHWFSRSSSSSSSLFVVAPPNRWGVRDRIERG